LNLVHINMTVCGRFLVTVDCVWEVLGVSGVYVDLARVTLDCLLQKYK